MTDNISTNKSIDKVSRESCSTAPGRNTSAKATLLSRSNNIRCGKMTGNPRMAINAAFCCALAAMADIRVNTILMPAPPINTIPMNNPAFSTGLDKKIKKSNKRHNSHTRFSNKKNKNID